MQQILLNNSLILTLEPQDKKVRMIVSATEGELACRKESIGQLKKFLATTEGTIFKGRLQLSKHGDVIEVIVKNRSIAVVATSVFEQALENLLSGK